MKKIFCLLLCLMLVVFSVAACGDDEDSTPPHEHTYDTAWSSNATTHWYAPTCEHTDALASVALHVDATNDGVCDVCEYGSNHTHTYAAEWTMTETEHYKKVTCGHNVTPSSKGAHVDEDNNKLCDVCSYDYNHTHTYATEWTVTDAEYHWHAVTCGCDVAPADKALHADLDDDGYCDVCEVAMYKAGHTHAAAQNAQWKTDASNHWKACADHEGYILNKEAHTGLAGDGVCDVCGWYDVQHTHAFAPEWARNDEGHWHAASCGHATLKDAFAAHADEDENGACDVCGYSEHEHTPDYTAGLQTDETGHWIIGACECADSIKIAYAEHLDLDKDGICDACYFVVCEHEFEDEWTVEEITEYDEWLEEEVVIGYAHYHAATCDCDVVDYDTYHEHIDINGNGICDVCYSTVPGHVHASEWPEYVYNENEHWYYCDDCFAVVVDRGEHDGEAEGTCDICGCTEDYFSFLDGMIPSLNENVYAGTVEYVSMYQDYYGEFGFENSTIVFEYGDELFHYFELDGNEYWYTLDANGELFGVYAFYDGGIANLGKSYNTDIAYLDGLEFNLYTATGVSGYAYGVENFVQAIYSAGYELGQNFYVKVEMDEYAEVATIDFGFMNVGSIDEALYQVEVSIIYNGDILPYIEIATTTYSSDSYTLDEDTGIATLNEDAEVTGVYAYVINQKEGERLAVTEHTADKYIVDDYVLEAPQYGGTVADGATLGYELSYDALMLNIRSESIGVKGLSFEELVYSYYTEVEITEWDEELEQDVVVGTEWQWITSDYHETNPFNIYLDTYENTIVIGCNDNATAGSYKIKLELLAGGWSQVINVEATAPAVSEVVLNEWLEGWENSWVEEKTIFVTNTAKFTVTFNAFASGTVSSFKVLKNVEDGEPVDVTEDVLTLGSNLGGSKVIYEVTPTEVGTYTIVATYGEGDEALTDSITLVVNEPPAVEDLLNGEWSYYYYDGYSGYEELYTITFVPAEEGALNGTCFGSITVFSFNMETYETTSEQVEFTGTYSYVEGVLTVIDDATDEELVNGFGEPAFSFDAENFVVLYGENECEMQEAAE